MHGSFDEHYSQWISTPTSLSILLPNHICLLSPNNLRFSLVPHASSLLGFIHTHIRSRNPSAMRCTCSFAD